VSGLVVDASVWLAARDADDRFHDDARRLIADGSGLSALDLTLYEVANVATASWGSPAESDRLVSLVLKACGGRIMRVDAELMHAAAATAAKHAITAYDAAYVVCAANRSERLVSGDLRDLVNRGLAITPGEALAG
jgi:predicted nucleic acid-binding protein